MAYDIRDGLFKWEDFNPNGMNTILFLLFLIPGIFLLIDIFDRRPREIINKDGIWKRKNMLPFSSLILINWNEIQYFYLYRETRKNVNSCLLIIRKKDTEKDVKVELTGLDKSVDTILSLFRQYAFKYGIHDLGEEIS
jgi:hypothetical protein